MNQRTEVQQHHELRLTRYMEGEPTRVFTKQELVEALRFSGQRELDAVASRMRRDKGLMFGVWGIGYRLTDVTA